MRNTKSIVREVFLSPAHLIWVAWRVSGADNDDMTFSQIWKSTYDEFVAETSTRGRFAFALLGSIGIYAVCVIRAIRGASYVCAFRAAGLEDASNVAFRDLVNRGWT